MPITDESFGFQRIKWSSRDCCFPKAFTLGKDTTIRKYSAGWGCNLVVGHMLSMYEALGSIPSTTL